MSTNILLINGSPKGKQSNTYKLATAFIEGLKVAESDVVVEEICVNVLDLNPCLGCFSCWNKTPGKCVFKDDMPEVIEKLLWADITIWSFPLYYFSVPGKLKTLIDRQLPMVLPFMEKNAKRKMMITLGVVFGMGTVFSPVIAKFIIIIVAAIHFYVLLFRIKSVEQTA